MEDIAEEIRTNGWVVIKNYTPKIICDEINKTLKTNKPLININDPLPTQRGEYVTNKHVLSTSLEVFKEVTKTKIRGIATSFIGEKPLLKNVRTYLIKKGDPRFPWHADNINPDGSYDSSNGIVCILYLTDDVEEGTFWVSNFDSWNKEKNEKINPTIQEFSEWENGKGVSRIKAKKGDLFIFNQNLYHRHIAKKYDVHALFFQITGESVKTTEKTTIDLSMIYEFDKDLLTYLGLGKPNIGYSNPSTDIRDLSAMELFNIIYRAILSLPKSLINHSTIINKIKHNLYWKKKIRLSDLFKK